MILKLHTNKTAVIPGRYLSEHLSYSLTMKFSTHIKFFQYCNEIPEPGYFIKKRGLIIRFMDVHGESPNNMVQGHGDKHS